MPSHQWTSCVLFFFLLLFFITIVWGRNDSFVVTTPHTWYHKQHASITFVSMSPSQHEPYEAQVTIRKTMFKHQKNDNSSTYSEPNFREIDKREPLSSSSISLFYFSEVPEEEGNLQEVHAVLEGGQLILNIEVGWAWEGGVVAVRVGVLSHQEPIFQQTCMVRVKKRENEMFVIHFSKPSYAPGDQVKARVLALNARTRKALLDKDLIERAYIQDERQVEVRVWTKPSALFGGVYEFEASLSSEAKFGSWNFCAETTRKLKCKLFSVKKEVSPNFKLTVTTTPDNIKWSGEISHKVFVTARVCASHHHGTKVAGEVHMQMHTEKHTETSVQMLKLGADGCVELNGTVKDVRKKVSLRVKVFDEESGKTESTIHIIPVLARPSPLLSPLCSTTFIPAFPYHCHGWVVTEDGKAGSGLGVKVLSPAGSALVETTSDEDGFFEFTISGSYTMNAEELRLFVRLKSPNLVEYQYIGFHSPSITAHPKHSPSFSYLSIHNRPFLQHEKILVKKALRAGRPTEPPLSSTYSFFSSSSSLASSSFSSPFSSLPSSSFFLSSLPISTSLPPSFVSSPSSSFSQTSKSSASLFHNPSALLHHLSFLYDNIHLNTSPLLLSFNIFTPIFLSEKKITIRYLVLNNTGTVEVGKFRVLLPEGTRSNTTYSNSICQHDKKSGGDKDDIYDDYLDMYNGDYNDDDDDEEKTSQSCNLPKETFNYHLIHSLHLTSPHLQGPLRLLLLYGANASANKEELLAEELHFQSFQHTRSTRMFFEEERREQRGEKEKKKKDEKEEKEEEEEGNKMRENVEKRRSVEKMTLVVEGEGGSMCGVHVVQEDVAWVDGGFGKMWKELLMREKEEDDEDVDGDHCMEEEKEKDNGNTDWSGTERKNSGNGDNGSKEKNGWKRWGDGWRDSSRKSYVDVGKLLKSNHLKLMTNFPLTTPPCTRENTVAPGQPSRRRSFGFEDTDNALSHHSPLPSLLPPQSWLFDLHYIKPDSSSTKVSLVTPATVATWIGRGFCLHPNKPISLSPPFTTFTNNNLLSIHFPLPSSIYKEEIIVVRLTIYSHCNSPLNTLVRVSSDTEANVRLRLVTEEGEDERQEDEKDDYLYEEGEGAEEEEKEEEKEVEEKEEEEKEEVNKKKEEKKKDGLMITILPKRAVFMDVSIEGAVVDGSFTVLTKTIMEAKGNRSTDPSHLSLTKNMSVKWPGKKELVVDHVNICYNDTETFLGITPITATVLPNSLQSKIVVTSGLLPRLQASIRQLSDDARMAFPEGSLREFVANLNLLEYLEGVEKNIGSGDDGDGDSGGDCDDGDGGSGGDCDDGDGGSGGDCDDGDSESGGDYDDGDAFGGSGGGGYSSDENGRGGDNVVDKNGDNGGKILGMSMQEFLELKRKTKEALLIGYQRHLTFRQREGLYRSFGSLDRSISYSLTSFTISSFVRASKFIHIDPINLDQSMGSLEDKQLESGCFAHSDHEQALENYESVFHVNDFPYVLSINISHDLNKKLITDPVNPSYFHYIALITASLKQAKSQKTAAVLACLKGMHQRRNVLTNDPFPKNTTTYDDVVYLYTLSLFGKKHEDNGTECGRLLEMVEEQMVDGERLNSSSETNSLTMTAYLLLSYLNMHARDWRKVERIAAWLERQPPSLDSLITLEALTKFHILRSTSAYSPTSTSFNLTISFPNISHQVSPITIPPTTLGFSRTFRNISLLQNQRLEIKAEGMGGCASVEVRRSFHIESFTGDQRSIDIFNISVGSKKHPFKCHVKYLYVCAVYNGPKSNSNMAIITVTMPTGFSVNEESINQIYRVQNLKKCVITRSKVNFYFEKITKLETCLHFKVLKDFTVTEDQSGLVQVTDFFEPDVQSHAEFFIRRHCPPLKHRFLLIKNLTIAKETKERRSYSSRYSTTMHDDVQKYSSDVSSLAVPKKSYFDNSHLDNSRLGNSHLDNSGFNKSNHDNGCIDNSRHADTSGLPCSACVEHLSFDDVRRLCGMKELLRIRMEKKGEFQLKSYSGDWTTELPVGIKLQLSGDCVCKPLEEDTAVEVVVGTNGRVMNGSVEVDRRGKIVVLDENIEYQIYADLFDPSKKKIVCGSMGIN